MQPTEIITSVQNYFERVHSVEGDYIFLDEKVNAIVSHSHTSSQGINIKKQEEAKPEVVSTKPQVSIIDTSWKESTSLIDLNAKIHNCLNCKLGSTRKKFVFGVGNPNADVMVIGEAPGADEDTMGEPFVGRAGQLLTKILEAINFKREDVFIANIIKCRPPNNRRPEKDEVEQCEPYLQKQIELINPHIILALGLTAVDTLLKTKHTMKDVRGKLLDYNGRQLLVTYHPAALLRNPNWKKETWEDVKYLRKIYDDFISTKNNL